MKWTKEQDNILLNRGNRTTAEMMVLVGRSYKAVQQRMTVLRRRGFIIPPMGTPDWTTEEMKIFHCNVLGCTIEELQSLLPNRSYASIRGLCHRTQKFPRHKDVKGKNSWRFTGYQGLDGRRFGSYKKSAKCRKILFSVTPKYLWKVLERQDFKCALSGLPISIKSREEVTASPDRINCEKGYVKGNIQWVHKDVNLAKHTMSDKNFINLCKVIAEKWKNTVL